jgi:RNase P/RNase MRP subunit p29
VITFTKDALSNGALQHVMLLLDDLTFRVEYTVNGNLKGVIGRVVGSSDTELTIEERSMRFHIPWDEITLLEYQ